MDRHGAVCDNLMRKIPFHKMQGSGNDFILIDNRRGILKGMDLADLAKKVCDRHFSVGADGLIVIVPPTSKRAAHFKWRFYNADGSEAEMCGNGSRCAARFAYIKKIAPRKMAFETLAGIIRAEVKSDRVKVQLMPPKEPRLDISVPLSTGVRTGHFINTGVPHIVYFTDSLDTEDVRRIGRETRYHELFRPAGTNVNFVRVVGPKTLKVRTYERGVEDETLACGTGAVASAIIAEMLGKVAQPVAVLPRSNERLEVALEKKGAYVNNVYLEGEAGLICEGRLFI